MRHLFLLSLQNLVIGSTFQNIQPKQTCWDFRQELKPLPVHADIIILFMQIKIYHLMVMCHVAFKIQVQIKISSFLKKLKIGILYIQYIWILRFRIIN